MLLNILEKTIVRCPVNARRNSIVHFRLQHSQESSIPFLKIVLKTITLFMTLSFTNLFVFAKDVMDQWIPLHTVRLYHSKTNTLL